MISVRITLFFSTLDMFRFRESMLYQNGSSVFIYAIIFSRPCKGQDVRKHMVRQIAHRHAIKWRNPKLSCHERTSHIQTEWKDIKLKLRLDASTHEQPISTSPISAHSLIMQAIIKTKSLQICPVMCPMKAWFSNQRGRSCTNIVIRLLQQVMSKYLRASTASNLLRNIS